MSTTSGLGWIGDVTALVAVIRCAHRLKDARRCARPRDDVEGCIEAIVVAVALAVTRDMVIEGEAFCEVCGESQLELFAFGVTNKRAKARKDQLDR